ncbi:protein phosphatase 1 regulatory subunit 37-like [Xyrauchen texanus]|uniref:protein phosphatase 1 regulatory subunit 37-like n=1 Tax=Xyrauchen texanus TaxID=154827 RepID=UPI00224264BD|nr:protein phosphatase 1 regulatory subunit 37-like [Xyrauchen texanus]XP_051953017.1 protein phosphatase 1 regulatory subunit 37-like [Xyrauchen texanus]
MNCEEQAVDLCNAMTNPNIYDNTTLHSVDEILSRDGLKLLDGDQGERGAATEVADAAVLARLKDFNDKDEDIKVSTDIKAPNGSIASAAEPADPVNGSSADQQQSKRIVEVEEPPVSKCSVREGGDDDGEMDIGVDLSLDENGILEFESAAQTATVREDSASRCDNSLISETVIELHSQKPSEESSEDVLKSTLAVEAVSPASTPGEGAGIKHGSKRVTFPSDKDIVSGAVEPKDPWRHAQNVTVEEILNAYRQACQKLNCKPIPKVLKQLQELKDLTQRNECLDLKGEKLDYKSSESLEEIFKRVQFKVVDLEQTNLDEDGASALFDMIEYYESATHLNISFNKHIGTRGWQAAAHMMRKTSSLQYLEARNTPLLDHSAPFVARALRISGSLTILHLENTSLSGRPLMLLATALKMNMNLRELYLADNKLNGLQDSAQLGNLLKFNYNIQILDLRNNHILDSGLAYVCEGLKEQRKGLVTLVLWNNQLTHNGMGYLAAALPFTQSLETLNLGHNAVGNEGVHKLKDGLIANRSILRLGLASTKLSCEGAVAIAEFIADSPRLLRLDLRENEIKTGGLMALSLAFKVNTSLLRLDLDREPKKETVKIFIETQRALLADIQNGCKRNFISAKEKEETEQKMRHSASMAEIATEDLAQDDEDEDPSASAEKQEDEIASSQKDVSEEGSEELSENQQNKDQITSEQDDSDTDTEDEDVTDEVNASASTTPPMPVPLSASAVNASPIACKATPPIPPPHASPAISGIAVSDAIVAPGTPPSPGRCFSVSSPGRGHKIFMVTRVESPPEKQQLTALSICIHEKAAESQTNKTAPQEPTKAPSQLSEQKSTNSSTGLNETETPTKVQQCSEKQPPPTQSDMGKHESPQPARTQPAESKLTTLTSHELDAATTPGQAPTEPLSHKDETLTPSFPVDKQDNVQERIHSDKVLSEQQASISESTQESQIVSSENQTTMKTSMEQQLLESQTDSVLENQSLLGQQITIDTSMQRLHEQDQAVSSCVETSCDHNVQEFGPSQTEPSVSEQSWEETLNAEAESKSVQQGRSEDEQVQSKEQQQTAHIQTSPDVTDSHGPLEAEGCVTPEEVESSTGYHEEISSEEAEGLLTVTTVAALPNGLKPEFAFHLLEPEGPKPASYVTEHVSVTAKLSCGQDLEELLLDASLDTSRDAP